MDIEQCNSVHNGLRCSLQTFHLENHQNGAYHWENPLEELKFQLWGMGIFPRKG